MRQLSIGTVTLLFTDIEGSTRLVQQFGQSYIKILRKCRRILRAAFQQWNGREVDTQGDAFFVVFERASDAIQAARIAQQTFFSTHWPENISVRVRIGIHTGEPQAVEEGYVGLDVHHAARIMSAAHGGQVLLSQTTYDLVKSEQIEGITLQNRGEYQLKDIAGASRLFQMVIDGLPEVFLAPRTPTFRQNLQQVPSALTSFVGREQELAILSRQIGREEVRLLTLIGTAGVGKTRLVLQVANVFKQKSVEAVCFVALEQVRNQDEFLPAIAQALGIQEEKKVTLLEQIKAILHREPLLLILDNFEHILQARLLLADLLASCPTLHAIVTSRVRLHLQAEHLFEVAPLPLPSSDEETEKEKLLAYPSIALFIQRAQAVIADFQMTETNREDIVKICTYLDGLPLAIELAAAHLRHFSPENLRAQLEHGTIFLQGKAADIPERQQTLRQAIDWSYNLLAPDEQKVFRRIAVCSGGTTQELAEQICTAATMLEGEVAEILQNLIDQSMIQRQEDGKGGSRFYLLQALREYGVERLTDVGELEATHKAQSDYIVRWIEKSIPMLAGAEQVFWLDQLDREYENVRSVFMWLLDERGRSKERIEQGVRLCVALMRFWEIRCYFKEGTAWLEQALGSEQEIAPTVRAQGLHSAGFLALMQDETERAEAYLREGQILFRESGDRTAMADILRLQGNLAMVKNAYTTANRLLEESRAIDQEYGNTQRATSTRRALAQIAIVQGNYQQAFSHLQTSLTIYEARGEPYSAAYPRYSLAQIYFLTEQDQITARELAEQSLQLFRAVGNKRLMAHVLNLLGQIRYAQGEDEKAGAMLEESRNLFKEIGDRLGIADVLISLGRAEATHQKWDEARTLYEESKETCERLDAKELIAKCLEGYGEVLVNQGDAEGAVRSWGEAAAIRAIIVAPIAQVYRASYLQAIKQARAMLSTENFQNAWREGSHPRLELAIPR